MSFKCNAEKYLYFGVIWTLFDSEIDQKTTTGGGAPIGPTRHDKKNIKLFFKLLNFMLSIFKTGA